ncbi:LacI family DNA-binding transcriptional regulator [Jiangella asiatica]|uniref:LacI family DNA-binding transcriptional regulator n=1 Tax=Jiangella asiatica TaxID=2530372 RepID=UPI0013A5E8E2|nr:LacI family DNA-binding transcriptional regulator [Jiangella asiatica]
MLALQRQAHILNLVRSRGMVRTAELVAELGVSSMTIRRDLEALAEQGVIDKFHGGGALRTSATGLPADTASAAPDGRAPHPHVAIVVPADDYYFSSIVAGIREALDDAAVRRSLARSARAPNDERKLVDEMVGADPTGLLLSPSIELDRPDPDYADWLLGLPVPVVLVEREVTDAGRALSCVRSDHEWGCEQAVRHLTELGHRGVALVTHGRSQSGTRVINGWRAAVERLGVAGRRSPMYIAADATAGWATDEGIEAILDQLAESGVTGLICHSDQIALPLARRARLRGWSVPDDLSIVAYDDESAEMADPPLTAVSPPKAWIGRTAVRTLLELIADGDDAPVRRVVAQPRLVLRGSTAAPRTASSG